MERRSWLLVRNASGFLVILLLLLAAFYLQWGLGEPYLGCTAVEECRQAQLEIIDAYEARAKASYLFLIASLVANLGVWSHFRARELGLASGDHSGEGIFH